MVGTDSAKATIMGRFRSAQPATPGYSHFPADRQQPYFEQLLGEALVTTYSKGQPVREWRPKKGVRHDALDARVYAYAALRALVSMGLVLNRRSRSDRRPGRTSWRTTANLCASPPEPVDDGLEQGARRHARPPGMEDCSEQRHPGPRSHRSPLDITESTQFRQCRDCCVGECL
jgi:phage terminase large subunit GpA-like protein